MASIAGLTDEQQDAILEAALARSDCEDWDSDEPTTSESEEWDKDGLGPSGEDTDDETPLEPLTRDGSAFMSQSVFRRSQDTKENTGVNPANAQCPHGEDHRSDMWQRHCALCIFEARAAPIEHTASSSSATSMMLIPDHMLASVWPQMYQKLIDREEPWGDGEFQAEGALQEIREMQLDSRLIIGPLEFRGVCEAVLQELDNPDQAQQRSQSSLAIELQEEHRAAATADTAASDAVSAAGDPLMAGVDTNLGDLSLERKGPMSLAFTERALHILQYAAEDYIVPIFEDALMTAVYKHRRTYVASDDLGQKFDRNKSSPIPTKRKHWENLFDDGLPADWLGPFLRALIIYGVRRAEYLNGISWWTKHREDDFSVVKTDYDLPPGILVADVQNLNLHPTYCRLRMALQVWYGQQSVDALDFEAYCLDMDHLWMIVDDMARDNALLELSLDVEEDVRESIAVDISLECAQLLRCGMWEDWESIGQLSTEDRPLKRSKGASSSGAGQTQNPKVELSNWRQTLEEVLHPDEEEQVTQLSVFHSQLKAINVWLREQIQESLSEYETDIKHEHNRALFFARHGSAIISAPCPVPCQGLPVQAPKLSATMGHLRQALCAWVHCIENDSRNFGSDSDLRLWLHVKPDNADTLPVHYMRHNDDSTTKLIELCGSMSGDIPCVSIKDPLQVEEKDALTHETGWLADRLSIGDFVDVCDFNFSAWREARVENKEYRQEEEEWSIYILSRDSRTGRWYSKGDARLVAKHRTRTFERLQKVKYIVDVSGVAALTLPSIAAHLSCHAWSRQLSELTLNADGVAVSSFAGVSLRSACPNLVTLDLSRVTVPAVDCLQHPSLKHVKLENCHLEGGGGGQETLEVGPGDMDLLLQELPLLSKACGFPEVISQLVLSYEGRCELSLSPLRHLYVFNCTWSTSKVVFGPSCRFHAISMCSSSSKDGDGMFPREVALANNYVCQRLTMSVDQPVTVRLMRVEEWDDTEDLVCINTDGNQNLQIIINSHVSFVSEQPFQAVTDVETADRRYHSEIHGACVFNFRY